MPGARHIEIAAAAQTAEKRIRDQVLETYLIHSPRFSSEVGAEVYFKLENLQQTGSFKLRGATNLLLSLNDGQRAKGCVAASSGNHGAGVACAAHKLDMAATVFVPDFTSEAKRDVIASYGGDVRVFGTDGLDTESHARAYAAEHGQQYVPPYNDPRVIAGQGTCGVEIVRQQADIDTLYVSVGGGGMISGVGSVLRTANPDVRIVGCQPRASAVMAHSIAAGHILDESSEPTLSDGTAGGIEQDSVTFALCEELVDEFVLVDEERIAAAMRMFIEFEHQLIEGAAGVAVAAMLEQRDSIAGRRVAALICGGNVSRHTLKRIL